MGLAKTAELNGYPRPMHTLKPAETTKLSAEQETKIQELLHRHKLAVGR
jgi:hypothetical protein